MPDPKEQPSDKTDAIRRLLAGKEHSLTGEDRQILSIIEYAVLLKHPDLLAHAAEMLLKRGEFFEAVRKATLFLDDYIVE
jgi:hypothetical protein